MYDIDYQLKKHIWKKKKNKQQWTKIKYLDLFCLILPIYVALFSIFHSIVNTNFTYFYGYYGTTTLSGRILSMFLSTFFFYLLSSVPYFIVHVVFMLTAGENFVDRIKEKIETNEEELVYSYYNILKPKETKKVYIKLNELTKITYMEDINKIHLYGNIYISETIKGIERERKLNDFILNCIYEKVCIYNKRRGNDKNKFSNHFK